ATLDLRNHAEGAGSIAAIGDLEVSARAAHAHVALGNIEDRVDIDAQEAGDILPLADAEDVVDGGVLFAHLAPIELRHAAGNDERLAIVLMGSERFDGRHRFGLALLDEAAGVHDDGVRLFGLEGRDELAAGEDALQVSAVDIVLRAAKRDE